MCTEQSRQNRCKLFNLLWFNKKLSQGGWFARDEYAPICTCLMAKEVPNHRHIASSCSYDVYREVFGTGQVSAGVFMTLRSRKSDTFVITTRGHVLDNLYLLDPVADTRMQ